MVLTTTNSIEGHQIKDYITIVTGVVMSKKTVAMGFSVSKYYKAVEESIDATKEEAFKKLIENAQKVGANAVVGVKVDTELTTGNYTMVSVTGTAVKVAL
ncbi:MAG: YbjQ family protein [Jejuia sp.]